MVTTLTDITARRQAEKKIQFLAHHDALTGLPNRAMFMEVLGFALEAARRNRRVFAVLFVDLDGFKIINDTLGHEAGDELLRQVARRLLETVRASDAVARLGGDEFVVLVQDLDAPLAAETVARKILAALAAPVPVGDGEHHVGASIGIATYPADGASEQELVKSADIAMYRAKEAGKNTCRFYSPGMERRWAERLELERALRQALERGELALHYQGRYELASGRLAGVEALLRWRSPARGLLSPKDFVPVAEETGLIIRFGEWVLQAACRDCAAWQRAGLAGVPVSVNISARQFAAESLLASVAEALAASGLAAAHLELELTESMVMHDLERAATLLGRLERLGARLAIDDFGTGYSSLAYLKRFPIDTLKIDGSFVRDLPASAEDASITTAIIAMARSLAIELVAEGVENAGQAEFLRHAGCQQAQGYYYGAPQPAEAFLARELARAGTLALAER